MHGAEVVVPLKKLRKGELKNSMLQKRLQLKGNVYASGATHFHECRLCQHVQDAVMVVSLKVVSKSDMHDGLFTRSSGNLIL